MTGTIPLNSTAPKKPKGILKNGGTPPQRQHQATIFPPSPRSESTSPLTLAGMAAITDSKELTIQNTLQNAGRREEATARRLSSASANSARSAIAAAAAAAAAQGQERERQEQEHHLKWDEANLYLTEQERTSTMKIDEPKTPFAPHYNPDEDEDDDEGVDGEDGRMRQDDIPDLDLGEPEQQMSWDRVGRDGGSTLSRTLSNGSNSSARSDKHVAVAAPPEVEEQPASPKNVEKHIAFEERRKKHYEMTGIKNLLAHPEIADEEDDEEDEGPKQLPPVPPIPDRFK